MALEHRSISEVLRTTAARYPDRPAVVMPGADTLETLSYADLLAAAEDLGGRLRAIVGEGGRVAVWSPGAISWLVTEYACALAGLVLMPINPALTDKEATDLLDLGDPGVLLCGGEFRGTHLLERARRFAPTGTVIAELDHWRDQLPAAPIADKPVDPSLDFLIQPTSGTTGPPKGAVLTQSAAMECGRLGMLPLEPRGHDIWCSPMPLHHVAGSVCIALGMLSVAGTMVIQPGFDPGQALRLIEATKATIFGAVPTILVDMLAHPEFRRTDLSTLRVVQIGGTTVPPSLIRRIEAELGVAVSVGYGQSEAPSSVMTALDDPDDIKAQTLGRPLPHREVKIVRSGTGETAACGETGEFMIRSPLVMSRYLGDSAATAEVLTDDGWLRTGDLCSMDRSGILRIQGRSREVIIRGGENIYPAEIEHVLSAHEAIAEIAVAGVPDERWGESVAAWVRPASGRTVEPAELESWARTQLASHKVPRTWTVVEDFPRTPSGKIQKFRLPGRPQA